MKRFLAIMLALTLVLTTVTIPAFAAGTSSFPDFIDGGNGVTYIDFSKSYSTDTIAAAGDSITGSWYSGHRYQEGSTGGWTYNEYTGRPMGLLKSYFTDIQDASGLVTFPNIDAADTNVYKFYMPAAGFDGNVNDSIATRANQGNQASSTKIGLKGIYTDAIRFVADTYGEDGGALSVSIGYEDGTVQTATSASVSTYDAATLATEKNNMRAIARIAMTENARYDGTTKTISAATVAQTFSGTDTSDGVRGLTAFDIKTTNKNSIPLYIQIGRNNSYNTSAVYAVTQIELAFDQAACEAAITAANALADKTELTDTDIAAIRAAVAADEQLTSNGATTSVDRTKLSALVAKMNVELSEESGIHYVDISKKLDSDIIASVGDTTTTDLWFGGLKTSSGTPVTTRGFQPSRFTQTYGVVTFSSQGSSYAGCAAANFQIPMERQRGGVADSVYISSDNTSSSNRIKFDLANTNTENVKLAIFDVGGNGSFYIKVNYADGSNTENRWYKGHDFHTATQQSSKPYGIGSAIGAIGWTSWSCCVNKSTWPIAGTPEADGTLPLVESTSTGNNYMGMRGIQMNTDPAKIATEVEIYSTATNIFLCAITQDTVTNDEILAKITAAAALTTETLREGIATLDAGIAYLPIAELRGVDVATEKAAITALDEQTTYMRLDDETLGAAVDAVYELIDAETDITKDNAQIYIEGYNAGAELYARASYDVLGGEEGTTADVALEIVNDLKSYATQAEAVLNADLLNFDATFAPASGMMTATVTMTNTKTGDQPYVLIIAAYKDGKLAGVNIGTETKVSAGTVDGTDSISVAEVEGATYKVFAWEDLSTLKPLFVKGN